MNPFALPLSRHWPASAPAVSLMERLLGLRQLAALYDSCAGGSFVRSALRQLEISVGADDVQLRQVPPDGPLIVIANHPSGLLDGLAMVEALTRVRPDVKLLGNHLLTRIPEMAPRIIAVDAFRSHAAITRRGLREARAWLERGGCVVIFPGGAVSHVRDTRGCMVDGEWRRGVLRLVEWTAAPIVPAFINGGTTRMWRWARRIHPMLATALLPRELLARRGSRVTVSVGAPVAPDRLGRLASDDARLAYLRARTYALSEVPGRSGRLEWRWRQRPLQPVAAGGSARDLAREVDGLPRASRLLTSGEYDVYCVAAPQIPLALREIGRLRELTFREAGEGTGAALDLDRFDEAYLHLFVWQRARGEIVGAYRLGLSDRAGNGRGAAALYTRTLFRFGGGLLRELGPTLELGRSFVRMEYQRESNGLLLLWKGIGRFVAHHPRYRRLFGPVSISADYRSLTRDLLARFLGHPAFTSELAPLVRPRRPLRPALEASLLVDTKVVSRLEDVELLVRELEDGRGLPVLLRQYLKLNARLLGFSTDPGFGNVLDALMLVDLLDVAPALLQRYLGREGAQAFLAHHGAAPPAAPAPSAPQALRLPALT